MDVLIEVLFVSGLLLAAFKGRLLAPRLKPKRRTRPQGDDVKLMRLHLPGYEK